MNGNWDNSGLRAAENDFAAAFYYILEQAQATLNSGELSAHEKARLKPRLQGFRQEFGLLFKQVHEIFKCLGEAGVDCPVEPSALYRSVLSLVIHSKEVECWREGKDIPFAYLEATLKRRQQRAELREEARDLQLAAVKAAGRSSLARSGQAARARKNEEVRTKVIAVIRATGKFSTSLAFAKELQPIIKEKTGINLAPSTIKSSYLLKMNKSPKVKVKQTDPK